MSYLIQCAPGLAQIMRHELVHYGLVERKQNLFIKRQRNHDLILLNKVKNADGFFQLRIAEAVYRAPVFGRFKISQRQLEVMAGELRELGPRRLVVQVAGRHFDRRDLERWLTKELTARGSALDANVESEVWMMTIDELFYFAIPLAKARDASLRNQRAQEREGSLPPTIAAALAFAGHPRPDDIIFDPVCGSGTLLAEARAYLNEDFRGHLVGQDIDRDAISIASENLKPVCAAESLKLEKLDSRKHAPTGCSLLIANLPFGKKFGEREANADLYKQVIFMSLQTADSSRYRAVLLSSDVEALRSAITAVNCELAATARPARLEWRDLFSVKIRGEKALAGLAQLRPH